MPASNAPAALRDRQHLLPWAGVLALLPARTILAVVAQAIVAGILALRGSGTPWQEAEQWLPLYGTLIDAGCLVLLWWFTRREGIPLFSLVGFDRQRLGRDVLLGLAIIPVCLAAIFGGVAISGWLIYGSASGPQFSEPLPLLPTLYALLIWPLVWGITEQLTYNGYVLPRLQVLSGSTALAVAAVAFFWAVQHSFMPLTFDPAYMLHRFVSSIPNSLVMILLYLRLRRLLPLILAHWLMDAASVLLPLLPSGS